MAYNFFLDSDIILDFLMERHPHYENSNQLFEKRVNGIINLYTTSSVILNVQYLSQKIIGKERSVALIKSLLSLFNISISSKEIIVKAYNSSFSDVKDAVQYYSATAEKAIDFFVTKNIKDYRRLFCRMKPPRIYSKSVHSTIL